MHICNEVNEINVKSATVFSQTKNRASCKLYHKILRIAFTSVEDILLKSTLQTK